MKRRLFLRSAAQRMAGFAGLSAIGWPESAYKQPAPVAAEDVIDPHDEAFWSIVRQHFPLTSKRIYLNTGGLGASPYVAIDALKAKIDELESVAETGHSEALWKSVKEKAGRILGCEPDEVAYTRNTTEGVNIVCNGLPLKRGDEIITSTHEHVGNTVAWLMRQKRDGIVVKTFVPSMVSDQMNLDRIESLIGPRTRVLSLSHITTATGQVLPLNRIGELARQHRLWYFVDGAQSAGMMPIDVHGMGCHAYATSGHKWLVGPKGTGLIYVRKEALDVIQARWVGAYSNTGDFNMVTGEVHLHPTAQRYEYGTMSAPLFHSLGVAMNFLLDIGLDNIWWRVHAMAATLIEGLLKMDAEVQSPQYPDGHSAMVTFRLPPIKRGELQRFLAQRFKLRTRGIYEGGLEGIRISLHIYNSFEDVNQVLAGVEAAKTELR